MELEQLLVLELIQNSGLLSRLYKILTCTEALHQTLYQKQLQQDCINRIQDKIWKHLWTSHSFRTQIFAIQFQTIKVMMRCYYPPSKLYHIHTNQSPLCPKQCDYITNFIQNWWHCKVIKNFGGKVPCFLNMC